MSTTSGLYFVPFSTKMYFTYLLRICWLLPGLQLQFDLLQVGPRSLKLPTGEELHKRRTDETLIKRLVLDQRHLPFNNYWSIAFLIHLKSDSLRSRISANLDYFHQNSTFNKLYQFAKVVVFKEYQTVGTVQTESNIIHVRTLSN
jgi:hypothetical protein